MSTKTQNPASEAQMNLIHKLIAERECNLDGHVFSPLTKTAASSAIDYLFTCPKKAGQKPQEELPDVMAGSYAVPGEDGALKFYVVDRPTRGRWDGFTFLSVQASDVLHPIKSFAAKRAILAKIAADPKAASAAYGREIGRCGVCGRVLTDEESRANGIGPVCIEKF